MTIDPKNLPHDLEGCWALLRQVLEELQRVQLLSEKQKHQIGQLLRARYGQRSDRFQDPNQLQLAIFEAMKETTPAPEPPAPKPEPSAKPRRRGHGRRPLPAELPRERVVHALPSAELTCPNCSRQRAKIREETVEQLEYVPASLKVIEHVTEIYACVCQEGVVQSVKPMQPIEKGLPGPGLLAHVLTSKYADHLPLNRLEGILERHGVALARSTMCGWAKAAAQLVSPLVDLAKSRVLAGLVIHCDDIPIPVQDRQRDRTRQGHIWTYVGDTANPYIVYDYTASRSREGPRSFLGAYSGQIGHRFRD